MRGLAAGMLVLLAACHGQPDFDAKYRDQSAQVSQSASAMERDLNSRLAAASAAGQGADAPDPATDPAANAQAMRSTAAAGSRAMSGNTSASMAR